MDIIESIKNLNLTIFDVSILFLIFIFAMKGIVRGFISEFSKIVGWVLGLIVATRYRIEVGELVNTFYPIGGETMKSVIGFFVTLMIFLFLVFLLNSFLTFVATKITGLNIINKFFGFVLGGTKVFLIFAIIVGALYGIPLIKEKIFERYGVDKSFLYPFLVQAGTYILNLQYEKDFNRYFKNRDENLTKEKNATKVKRDEE